MALFKNPSLATIEGWKIYEYYQKHSHNRWFNYTLFSDLQEWWSWIWEGYYEKYKYQIKELK